MWFLLGCTTELHEVPWPKLTLDTTSLEFGSVEPGKAAMATFTVGHGGYLRVGDEYLGLPMGVAGVDGEGLVVLSGDDDGFCAWWSAAEMRCPGEPSDARQSAARRARAGRAARVDSGAPPLDTGSPAPDTGGPPAEQEGCGSGATMLVLDPGCTLPVHVQFSPPSTGQKWAAVLVQSVQQPLTEEERDGGVVPDYARDPRNYVQQVFLQGTGASRPAGRLVASATSHDFGYRYPDGSSTSVDFELGNDGDADLRWTSSSLSVGCGNGFTVANPPSPGDTLAPGARLTVGASFSAQRHDPVTGDVRLESSGGSATLRLLGNPTVPSDPPSLGVVEPAPGAVVDPTVDLPLVLTLGDDLQPPSSLACSVWSSALSAEVARCEASDDSGTSTTVVPAGTLVAGADTLVVELVDAHGEAARAALPLAVGTAPAVDNDGDGHDPGGSPPDCDDASSVSYDGALELPDGLDNDCDGSVDEGTDIVDGDGDGYTGATGDCDDDDPLANPARPERADGVDNDCDGGIDEGSARYDDDGDLWTEVDNDCDDDDPGLSPGAPEACDGLDNDCDGLVDNLDNCPGDATPELVGLVDAQPDACNHGETVTLEAHVVDVNGNLAGEALEPGYEGDGTSGVYTQTVSCDMEDVCSGKLVTYYVAATDNDGRQDWSSGEVVHWGEEVDLDPTFVVRRTTDCGCRADDDVLLATGSCGAALGLALWARRRRG